MMPITHGMGPANCASGKRRESPVSAVLRQRFGVDADICTGDHACIRLSGCPSLTVKHLDDPLRDDPVAAIDDSCVACGNCGDVADAAVLCPSFYRADVLRNASRWERFKSRVRSSVISFLQQRRERKRILFGRTA
jgi:indolepyruvate ferredoxin oxidoreductase alpha subunit